MQVVPAPAPEEMAVTLNNLTVEDQHEGESNAERAVDMFVCLAARCTSGSTVEADWACLARNVFDAEAVFPMDSCYVCLVASLEEAGSADEGDEHHKCELYGVMRREPREVPQDAVVGAPERGHERRHVTFVAAAGLGEVVVGRGRGAEVAEERRAEARRRQLSAVGRAHPSQIRVARRQHGQRHRRELRRRFDEIGRVLDAEDLAYEAQRRVEPPAPFRGDNSRVFADRGVESGSSEAAAVSK